MAQPAQWSELMVWQMVSDMHLWLLAGWFVFAVLAATAIGGRNDR